MNSANDRVRERLERVRERVRECIDQGLATASSVNDRANDSLSYGDDEIFHDSVDDILQNMSHELPTSTELFDERKAVRVDSNGDYDLKDLFCKSGRRYEMGLGLNSISSDIFNLKPVGDSLKFIIVSYHRKIKKCF